MDPVTATALYFGGKEVIKAVTPKIPSIPTAPKISDAEVQKAAAEEARRIKLGRGYRSTILGQMIQASGQPQLKQTLGG